MVIFTKPGDPIPLSEEKKTSIASAYTWAKRKFTLPLSCGGTHPLKLKALLSLIETINVLAGEISWEIGCGGLRLAAGLSCAADAGVVVAMDLGLSNRYYKIFLIGYSRTYCARVGENFRI